MLSLFLFTALHTIAQNDAVPVFKGATKGNREKMYGSIIKNSITKNLTLPLSDSTEEDWEDAFYAMELIHYKEPWIIDKMKTAFDSVEKRSPGFQRTLIEVCYVNFPTQFKEEIYALCGKTINAKIFAMAAEYIARADKNSIGALAMIGMMRFPILKMLDSSEKSKAILFSLQSRIDNHPNKDLSKKLKDIFASNYLPGNTIVYSIQRKDRNYPGIVIVKDKQGNFVTSDDGTFFSVPQLARSITNLPSYLTNGNTPQGIFRMYGFDVSKSPALGPTQNIQLTMPFETTIQHFLKDSSITDTAWTEDLYKKLLPPSCKKYFPAYETFYASKAGRTEIIAHGTTVDPEYYKGLSYYPHTPTEGCLCTKEIWSDIDGKRLISDQQKLVDAIKKAGGPDGYLIVLEIDDQQKPVNIDEILPYLKTK